MALTDRRARLVLLTGPSGVGKGTLVARLLERHPEVWLSISATTRSPRDGEQHGVQYFFHSRPSFDELVAQGGLLEWAEFAGNCYGTPRQPVMQRLDAGTPVLLEIELEGARQVRRSFPEAFRSFSLHRVLRSSSAVFADVERSRKMPSRNDWIVPELNWQLRRNLMQSWSTMIWTPH